MKKLYAIYAKESVITVKTDGYGRMPLLFSSKKVADEASANISKETKRSCKVVAVKLVK